MFNMSCMHDQKSTGKLERGWLPGASPAGIGFQMQSGDVAATLIWREENLCASTKLCVWLGVYARVHAQVQNMRPPSMHPL